MASAWVGYRRIWSQEIANEIPLGESFWLDDDPGGQTSADQGGEAGDQGIAAAVAAGERSVARPRAGPTPANYPSDVGADAPQSSDRWRAHVTNGIVFKPDADKTYFAFLLGAEGVSATDRLVQLHRHVLNGTSLTNHLLEELHPSDERLAKSLNVMKAGVARSATLRAAFGADIDRLQSIIDAEQVRAGAAYTREVEAFGKAYAIEAASNVLGFGAGKVIGKVAPIAIKAAAPSVGAFGKRVGGALSRLAESTAESVAVRTPNGKIYSVAYETRLSPQSYPRLPRRAHFREANEAFLKAIESDPVFAKSMNDIGINLQRMPRGLAPRTSPANWTWHHAQEPGIMQLVPRSQHRWGSIFQMHCTQMEREVLQYGEKSDYASRNSSSS